VLYTVPPAIRHTMVLSRVNASYVNKTLVKY
jgi:hypothetical protein